MVKYKNAIITTFGKRKLQAVLCLESTGLDEERNIDKISLE